MSPFQPREQFRLWYSTIDSSCFTLSQTPICACSGYTWSILSPARSNRSTQDIPHRQVLAHFPTTCSRITKFVSLWRNWVTTPIDPRSLLALPSTTFGVGACGGGGGPAQIQSSSLFYAHCCFWAGSHTKSCKCHHDILSSPVLPVLRGLFSLHMREDI